MLSSISEGNGVVYFFGNGYQEMALVSIYSLRKTGWEGPISIFPIWSYSDRRVLLACHAIAESGLNVELGPPVRAMVITHPESPRGVAGMVTKTLLPFMTTFRRTLLIDADTVVVKPIDDIFNHAAPLALTAFESDWQLSAEHSKRINAWRAVDSSRVSRIRDRHDPAVNTGVMVYDRPASQLVAWNELSMLGANLELPDEIAMQLLLPELEFEWLPEVWNYSPQQGPLHQTDPDEACIWHCHGPVRGKWPQWSTIYEPIRKEVEETMRDVYWSVRDTITRPKQFFP